MTNTTPMNTQMFPNTNMGSVHSYSTSDIVSFPGATSTPAYQQTITSQSLGNGQDIRTLGFHQSVSAVEQLRDRQIQALTALKMNSKSTSTKAVTLPVDYIVYVLKLCFAWTVINDRLAFWDSRSGIYNPDEQAVTTLISIAEPNLTMMASKDARFALKEAANRDIMLGRDDFPDEYSDTRRYVTFKNGIYDLKTKLMHKHTPKNKVIRCVQIEYQVDAPNVVMADGWDADKWLAETAVDPETETLFLQMIRVAIQPRVMEKSIWLYASTGRNGKGTMVEIFYQLLGIDHIANVTADLFSKEFVFANLDQKLAIIGDDVPANTYISDEGIFKKLHTGEAIDVNAKYKDVRAVRFSGLILQTTNELPRFKDKGNGLYRRILPVEFMQHFTTGNVNRNIKDVYLRDPRVLSHYVSRALALPDFDQYIEPKRSLEAMDRYKEHNDNTVEFMNEWFPDASGMINSTDTMFTMPKDALWTAYLQFCSVRKYNYNHRNTFYNTVESYLKTRGWKITSRLRKYEPNQVLKFLSSIEGGTSTPEYHRLSQGADKPPKVLYVRNALAYKEAYGDNCKVDDKTILKYNEIYITAQDLNGL